MNIAPPHIQILSMVKEMDSAVSRSQCHNIYINYLNLYRDEYPNAKRILERAYLWHVEALK